MIKHKRDEKNPFRNHYPLLAKWKERQPVDGLNSLKTKVSGITRYRTHLRLLVQTTPEPAGGSKWTQTKRPAAKRLIHPFVKAPERKADQEKVENEGQTLLSPVDSKTAMEQAKIIPVHERRKVSLSPKQVQLLQQAVKDAM